MLKIFATLSANTNIIIPCFMIGPFYLILAVSIHRFAPEEKKILSLLSLVFTIVYVAQSILTIIYK